MPKQPVKTKSPSDLAKVVGQIVALIEHLPTDEQKKVLDTVRVLTVGSLPVATTPPRTTLEDILKQSPPRPARPAPTFTYSIPRGSLIA